MSDKNSKIAYYVRAYARLHAPLAVMKWLARRDMRSVERRADRDEILKRVDYYCQLTTADVFDEERFLREARRVCDCRVGHPSVYFLDSLPYARRVGMDKLWLLLPGDVTEVPAMPSIVKSRPIGEDNANSVLLNMDKVRHFIFIKHDKPFREKKDVAIFRGLIGQHDDGAVKQNRYDFMKKCFGRPLIDAGAVDKSFPEWRVPKISIRKHLDYKFIMSLEGNDVASNLKWVMSSNSVAVMPRPTCETWFMEGTLIPNYHYIECKADFSDLEERLHYYIEHPEEAEAIIEHAHEYVAQFQDKKRERIISLLVMEKYFQMTGQK